MVTVGGVLQADGAPRWRGRVPALGERSCCFPRQQQTWTPVLRGRRETHWAVLSGHNASDQETPGPLRRQGFQWGRPSLLGGW